MTVTKAVLRRIIDERQNFLLLQTREMTCLCRKKRSVLEIPKKLLTVENDQCLLAMLTLQNCFSFSTERDTTGIVCETVEITGMKYSSC